MVQSPDKKNNTFTDKATKRLRQFEDARTPQELPDDPEVELNNSIHASSVNEAEDNDEDANAQIERFTHLQLKKDK